MPLTRAIYRENRIRDDVAYEVIVYAMPGGVYGSFKCPVCELSIVNASPDDAEALRATLIAVDVHHEANHSYASNEKSRLGKGAVLVGCAADR